MNLIDVDKLRKDLMAKGDIPIHEVFNTIWDQPLVTPKASWIPVSERLPEERGHYLVTVKIEIPELDKLCFDTQIAGFDGVHLNTGYMGDDIRVIAWTPLPEPYKIEGEDKE